MPEPLLDLGISDETAWLTLNAPPRNEMSKHFFELLADLVHRRCRALRVKGLVVHGAGRHFSSGANVAELTSGVANGGRGWDQSALVRSTMAFEALHSLPYPVIAAVSGCCFGSAMELALSCHYRMAAHNAVFALPETTFGIMPGCGGTVRLPHIAGVGPAIRMILSGEPVAAAEALRVGLVDLVVPPGELLRSAEALIRRLSGMGGAPT